jgi:hypothetical protein
MFKTAEETDWEAAMGKAGSFVPPSTVERFGPGKTVTDPQPGDFLLTHASGFSNTLIRWGQNLRSLRLRPSG